MKALTDFFNEKARLPSPPAVALKILKAVKNDQNSFDELAAIIKADPALTARVLKIANSSLYGIPKRVDSIAQATSLIGTQTLKNIALSFVLVEKFQESHFDSFNLNLFWRRAITAAVAAEILAKKVSYQDHDIFISALLQDIGVIIMFFSEAESYSEVFDVKRVNGKSTCEVENEIFGFNHAEVSSHLFESWNLSDNIFGPIRLHHSAEPEGPHTKTAQILNIADKISSIYHGTQSNKKSIETRKALAEIYNLPDEDVGQIIDVIGEKAKEVMDLFAIDPGEMKPFSCILQEANDELRLLNFSYEQVVLELVQAKQKAEKFAIELKRKNQKLRELAIRDGLTGLFNHRYFHEFLEHEAHRSARYKQPLSIMLLDIDHFKNINDTYGHPSGDTVLKELGEVLMKLVRQCDVVARYGGEEFGVILPSTSLVGAKVLAQRLRRGVEQLRVSYKDEEISITISIGLASLDEETDTMTAAALILKSDRALYRAKHNGRNRVEF